MIAKTKQGVEKRKIVRNKEKIYWIPMWYPHSYMAISLRMRIKLETVDMWLSEEY